MVKRLRLNEKSVREAAPEPGRDYQIFDSEVRGFAICIYRSGNRAFTLDYRHAGRQRRMTLGRWPEWSTAAAREPKLPSCLWCPTSTLCAGSSSAWR